MKFNTGRENYNIITRKTKEKTKRDVQLLETFFRNEKNDEREVQDIEDHRARRIKQAPCGVYSFCET